jgi:phospholipase/carboxylesterase
MKQLTLLLLIALSCFQLNAQQVIKDDTSGLEYLIKKGNNGNVIILMHGYGSNEKDLFSFAKYFPEGTTIVCPRAPITYSPTSFAWYDIEFKADGNHQRNLEQGLASAATIERFVTSIKKQYSITGTTVVGGFSQGAIMSINLAINNPKLINGVIGLSGTLLHENLKPNESLKSEYCKLKVFYGHGIKDELLSIKHGRFCKKLLNNAGVQLTYKEYPIQHSISQQEVQDLMLWYMTNF